jgi:hypothetical protein
MRTSSATVEKQSFSLISNANRAVSFDQEILWVVKISHIELGPPVE